MLGELLADALKPKENRIGSLENREGREGRNEPSNGLDSPYAFGRRLGGVRPNQSSVPLSQSISLSVLIR